MLKKTCGVLSTSMLPEFIETEVFEVLLVREKKHAEEYMICLIEQCLIVQSYKEYIQFPINISHEKL